jgi:hypothetical protein
MYSETAKEDLRVTDKWMILQSGHRERITQHKKNTGEEDM